MPVGEVQQILQGKPLREDPKLFAVSAPDEIVQTGPAIQLPLLPAILFGELFVFSHFLFVIGQLIFPAPQSILQFVELSGLLCEQVRKFRLGKFCRGSAFQLGKLLLLILQTGFQGGSLLPELLRFISQALALRFGQLRLLHGFDRLEVGIFQQRFKLPVGSVQGLPVLSRLFLQGGQFGFCPGQLLPLRFRFKPGGFFLLFGGTAPVGEFGADLCHLRITDQLRSLYL